MARIFSKFIKLQPNDNTTRYRRKYNVGIQHTPKKKRNPLAPQKDSLLIDIQRKMDEGKGTGYVNWAKKAFDESGMTKLPTVKSLQAEYAELLTKKKVACSEYRTACEEMKELLLHKSNIDRMMEKEDVTHDEQKKKHERK